MAFADFSDVLEWTVNPTIDTHPYASSETSGARKRVTSITDWAATVRQMAQGSGPEGAEGDNITLVLIPNMTASAQAWSGACFIVSIDTAANVNDGSPIEYTYNIEGDGVLTPPAGAGTAPYSSKSGNARWEVI